MRETPHLLRDSPRGGMRARTALPRLGRTAPPFVRSRAASCPPRRRAIPYRRRAARGAGRTAMARTDEIIDRAQQAADAFRRFNQPQTDAIVHAACRAAIERRFELARLAHAETGIGIERDKALKNLIASQFVCEDIRGLQTVGVVRRDDANGITEIVQPVGPVLGLTPVTNPTSTAIFKCLICLKTRNPLIISPHMAAKRCTVAAAQVCYEAALAAGAPADCIQWLAKPTPKAAGELMSHRGVALIIATGTSGLVRTAQSSGAPVLGVGPGNVPACVTSSADAQRTAALVMESKTFDNGTVCASEQALVVERPIAGDIKRELCAVGAHFMTSEQAGRVAAFAYDAETRSMSAAVVGRSVAEIAQRCGIDVAPDARLLVAALDAVGSEAPLSAEILAPILAWYVEDDFDACVRRCEQITRFGGVGHTAVIHTGDAAQVETFARRVDVARILVNTPATHGALGGTWNALDSSFTLACGGAARNINADNITARHLLQTQRIARPRRHPAWESA
ncbi:MAG: aldehyde dehydrogenase family protein [Planctomycetota bacterium]|nr:MAG: aldehyde dehydrogenase family protein [Planctomycetota bacterium]